MQSIEDIKGSLFTFLALVERKMSGCVAPVFAACARCCRIKRENSPPCAYTSASHVANLVNKRL